jgi:hypothetical protein
VVVGATERWVREARATVAGVIKSTEELLLVRTRTDYGVKDSSGWRGARNVILAKRVLRPFSNGCLVEAAGGVRETETAKTDEETVQSLCTSDELSYYAECTADQRRKRSKTC